MKHSHVLFSAAIILGLALAGCGGSPTSPSEGGVTLHGTALGDGVSTSASTHEIAALATSGGSITVSVEENPSLTTAISANGTFQLGGLPSGAFTLVFTSKGKARGKVSIGGVPSTAQVDVVVQVSANSVALVNVRINGSDHTGDQPKTCLINGGTVNEGIELEGAVHPNSVQGLSFQMDVNGNRASGPVAVSAATASFTCAGIKGTCDATLLKDDARVHVRGTLTSCSMTAALVTAAEVKFQH